MPPGAKECSAIRRQYLRICSLPFLLVLSLSAAGQSGNQWGQIKPPSSANEQPDELRQQLDVDAAALSKLPADPLIRPDPLAPIFQPVDKLTDRIAQSTRLKFGATYTFLSQYATIAPDGDQAQPVQRTPRFHWRLECVRSWKQRRIYQPAHPFRHKYRHQSAIQSQR